MTEYAIPVTVKAFGIERTFWVYVDADSKAEAMDKAGRLHIAPELMFDGLDDDFDDD